ALSITARSFKADAVAADCAELSLDSLRPVEYDHEEIVETQEVVRHSHWRAGFAGPCLNPCDSSHTLRTDCATRPGLTTVPHAPTPTTPPARPRAGVGISTAGRSASAPLAGDTPLRPP